jgi:hypothetical protein
MGEFDDIPLADTAAAPKRKGGGFDDIPLADAGNSSSGIEKLSAFGKGANVGLADVAALPFDAARGIANLPALGAQALGFDAPLAFPTSVQSVFRGGLADTGMGFREEKDLPQDQRPFAVAGEVVGGSVPFAGIPLGAALTGARLPATKVGNFLNKIIEFAATSPKTFVAGEAAGVTGAAAAGGFAEAAAPGNIGVRVGAEVAGGFFNPTRLAVGAAKGTVEGVRAALNSLSRSGRETQAAKALQEILNVAGEDPDLVAKLLRQSGIPGTQMTAAQKTASPALIALESKLSQDSARFGNESRVMAEESLSTMRNMIVALRGTGDPAALSKAASIRARYHRTLISGRVQQAERETIEAAARMSTDNPSSRADISRVARESLESALTESRKVESELWEKLPKDIPINIGKARIHGIMPEIKRIRDQLLPEESLPPLVEKFVERMATENGATNFGELRLFRSRMLSLAREAQAKSDFNDARIFGSLAEAALDDMNRAFEGASGGVLRTLGAGMEDYNAARTFSRELHDTFSRTFGGKALGTDQFGGDRIPPELLLRRALGAGKEAGDLRLDELEQATRFLSRKGLGTPETEEAVGVMMDAQERLIRLAAADAVDPNTGRVSATRLGKFLRDNEKLLDRFPEARTAMQEALSAETGLSQIQKLAVVSERAIDTRTVFARLAKVENPVDAIQQAIRGRQPVRDLTAFIKLARGRSGGIEASDGLRGAIYDYAMRGTGGEPSFDKMRKALFDPIRPNTPSVMDVMKREGLVTQIESEKLAKLLSAGRKIEAATASPEASLGAVIKENMPLLDTVLRVVGSKSAKALGGDTLIAQSAGSKFLRRMFEKVGLTGEDVLIEAAKNPRLAAALLEKPTSVAKEIRLARQVHAYLFQAGLIPAEEDGSQ